MLRAAQRPPRPGGPPRGTARGALVLRGRPDRLVAAVAPRRTTAFVLLGNLTTASGGEPAALPAAVGAVLFAVSDPAGPPVAAGRGRPVSTW
jgi:hypothetical protein